ncbi:MAG: hypothetical protein ABF755_01005 [Oenococcus oeni]
MKIDIYKPKDFVSKLNDFLESDVEKNILIRGYFDDDKLYATMYALQQSHEYVNGNVVLGSINLPSANELFQRAITSNFPKFDLQRKIHTMGLNLSFSKYDREIDMPFGFEDSFTLFFPVESVFFSKRDFSKLKHKIESSKADKNIFITTNDFSQRAEMLYPFVDEVLVLDTTDLDDKHLSTFETIKNNIALEGETIPY